jgi:hypothetical protein
MIFTYVGVLTNERDTIQTRFIDMNKRFEDLNMNLAVVVKDRDDLLTAKSDLLTTEMTLKSQILEEKKLYNEIVLSKDSLDNQVVLLERDMAKNKVKFICTYLYI